MKFSGTPLPAERGMRRTIPHHEKARLEPWLLEPQRGPRASQRSSSDLPPRAARQGLLPTSAPVGDVDETELIGFSSESVEGDPIDRPEEEPPPAPLAPAPRRLRFLLVEDDADSRNVLSALLTLHGHAVESVGTGREAIAAARRAAFDAVLVDVGLPDIDGYGVGRSLRERSDPSMVRVALTGHDGPEAREQSRAAGFHLHLVKPVELARLLAAVIAELGARRLSAPTPEDEGESLP
jgi:CheY-like chemotaxis protein